MALRLREIELSVKTLHGPVLKTTQLSAKAQNHVSIERCRKSFTTIVLGDHDFPLTPSNFGNLTAEYPPYFYFRSSWPTVLESVTWRSPGDESFHRVWSWYDHALSSYSVIDADTLRDLVTLTFDLFTLVSRHTWRVMWSTPPPSLKILRLYVLELWVLTSPIGYHWQCVCSHCACAVSCDLCVGVNLSRIFEIHDPDLPIHYTTFMALGLRQMELSATTMYGPVLKITQLSARAQNYVSVERCRKYFTTIVLGDHDFPSIASNFGILTAFRATFGHIFTAHAQKRLFMNFRLKFWHHHSIPWPRFFTGHDISAIWWRFLLIFALDKLNVRHISTSGLVDLLS